MRGRKALGKGVAEVTPHSASPRSPTESLAAASASQGSGDLKVGRGREGGRLVPGARLRRVPRPQSYTTYGLELTRVTVVDTDVHVVYDTFVKPDNEIVDYNTRFSGVTEADLADTSVTLRDVQAVLLSMFSADTILIGHSLESDLLALKVPCQPGSLAVLQQNLRRPHMH